MNIEWYRGKPEEDGEYVVVISTGSVYSVPYTKAGWNTSANSTAHAFPDGTVVAWAKNFGNAVLDIYGHCDIIEEEKEA